MEGAAAKDFTRMECGECQAERAGRHRVVNDAGDERFGEAPFDAAPYIHPQNVPKYKAFLLRAKLFARRHGRCVFWICAHDKPLHQDDRALTQEALNEKRRRW